MQEKLNNLLEEQNKNYLSNTKNSFTKHKTATKVMPGGNTRTTQWMDPYPFFVDKAEGMYIYDIDENKYLDFMLNATTLILGQNLISEQSLSSPTSILDFGNLDFISAISDLNSGNLNFND